MPVHVNIILGPARSGKTARLLAQLDGLADRPWSMVLWFAPNRRCAEETRVEVLAAQHHSSASQRRRATILVTTFQDWADSLIGSVEPERLPLSRGQRRLLLEELLAEALDHGHLAEYAPVVDTRGLANGLSLLWEELLQLQVATADLRRLAQQCGITRPWVHLYGRYCTRLTEARLLDPESRLSRAAELLASGRLGPFSQVQTIFVDDFFDFSPLQQAILRQWHAMGREVHVTLPHDADVGRAELFTCSQLTMQRFSASVRIDTIHQEADDPSPCGLRHLERNLFRPVREIQPTTDASGLVLLQAPGLLGETRLVARHIRALLAEGVPAEQIVVAVRELVPYADLVHEVFREYEIPLDVEGIEPLTRSPAIAVLLRALRLPEDDWRFGDVTALLRSGYFSPQWPETRHDPEVPQQAETLLRLLAEPRGREAYLAAVRRWAEAEQPGLEDEDVLASRRRRTHELARQTAPFLERFFRLWDSMPTSAPLAEHVNWIRSFALDLGIVRVLQTSIDIPGRMEEKRAWERLWEEIDHWQQRESAHFRAGDVFSGRRRVLERRAFLRHLQTLAMEAGVARTLRGPGRVRFLSARLACTLHMDYLFVLGLGERGFPQLSGLSPLIDEIDRQHLREAGLDLQSLSALLPVEQMLFYQLTARARRRLTLSYPAVDERGQDLLPSSFLRAVQDCFVPGSISTERRSLLLEGVDRDVPFSLVEQRVRAACVAGILPAPQVFLQAGLPADQAANLASAATLAHHRFRSREFSAFEGMLTAPIVQQEIQRLFGPESVFSPTALEDYVHCPFRFFLAHVLRLEPLEDPREEIEVTRRGQAVHRALSRLHRQLREQGCHRPSAELDKLVLEQYQAAIEEDVHRATGLASKALWKIEGKRLLRLATRYLAQWSEFLKKWEEHQVVPEPRYFETDFGMNSAVTTSPSFAPLILRGKGIEVRINGRIDRVDVASLESGVVFCVIDYKTGRRENYSVNTLLEFKRLQLTLYALAVQEVLLADQQARPLSVGYWLVGQEKPHVMLPGRKSAQWLEQPELWARLREVLCEWVLTLVEQIRSGAFPLSPREEHCTRTCSFGQVCRITQARGIEKNWSLELPVLSSEQTSAEET